MLLLPYTARRILENQYHCHCSHKTRPRYRNCDMPPDNARRSCYTDRHEVSETYRLMRLLDRWHKVHQDILRTNPSTTPRHFHACRRAPRNWGDTSQQRHVRQDDSLSHHLDCNNTAQPSTHSGILNHPSNFYHCSKMFAFLHGMHVPIGLLLEDQTKIVFFDAIAP